MGFTTDNKDGQGREAYHHPANLYCARHPTATQRPSRDAGVYLRGQENIGEYVKGRRYPITYGGLKSQWRCLRKRAGVEGFRFHDFRHNFGSKLLRETQNLKLVQRAMNHANITTTTRYAHVLDDDVAAALERHQQSRNVAKKVG